MTARKLIEEAKKRMKMGSEFVSHRTGIKHYCAALDILDEALSLLPEWQEFDPKREETWPKEEKWYVVEICTRQPSISYWNSSPNKWTEYREVLAYQPLPQPYVRP